MERQWVREKDYKHFSHRHLLIPLEYEESDDESNCKACERPIKDPFHGCLSCKYFLHDQCLNTPRWLQHPSHPAHSLTLLPTPTYPNGSFWCNACGSTGNSFSFSCAQCEFDLHIGCATLSSSLLVDAVHPHELKMDTDITSNENKTTVFDVCGAAVNRGYWVYRCDDCDFDCHLDCVKSDEEPAGLMNQNQTIRPYNEASRQLGREDGVEPLREVANEMMENQLQMMRLQNQLNRTQIMANLMSWPHRY